MAWTGYVSYAGTEIINVARLKAYKDSLNIHWLKPYYDDAQYVEAMLGADYRFPWLDAPWFDNDNPDSVDFYGLYPLNIQGFEDSTRNAQVTESILDGGVVGRLRNATRSIVFEAALVGGSECGVDYGLKWLKKALNGVNCDLNSLTSCAGNNLDFFSCAPFYSPDGVAGESFGNSPIVRARLDGGYWIGETDFSVDSPRFDAGDSSTTSWDQFDILDGGSPAVTGGVLTPPYEYPFNPDYAYNQGDTFTRANSTTNLGSTDLPAAWTQLHGTWGINTNKAYVSTGASASNYSIAYITAPFAPGANAVAEVTLSTVAADTFTGMFFRGLDRDNCYIATSTEMRLRVAGVETVAGTFSTPFVSGDRMRIVGVGQNVTVYRQAGAAGDYDSVLTFTDTDHATEERYGLATYGSLTTHRFDDFILADANNVTPEVPFSPSDCLPEFQRHFRNVAFTQGPTVTKKKALAGGAGYVWTVTFTAVCGVPWEFGEPVEIISNFLGPTSEWGVDGGTYDDSGSALTDEACLVPTWEPLQDPNCPALIPPPGVPEVSATCFSPPEAWTRRWFTIPENQIPTWGDVVPLLRVTADFDEARDIRIRFYRDDGTHTVADNCSPVGDFLFSFVPIGYIIVVDAEAQIVYAVDELGNQRRADSLVFASDGTPFDWPSFSCGDGLIVTVDTPTYIEDVPAVSLSLVSKGS